MPFDVQGARDAGYSDADIANFLGTQYPKYDVTGAMGAGHSLEAIAKHLGQPAQQAPPAAPFTFGGLGQAVNTGLARGIAGAVSFPRTAADIAAAGYKAVTGNELPRDQAMGPSYEDVIGRMERARGEKFYEPQNMPERFAARLAEYAPTTPLGVGGIGAKIAQTVAPALATQAVQEAGGTPTEELLTGVAAGGLTGALAGKGAARTYSQVTMPQRAAKVKDIAQKQYQAVEQGATGVPAVGNPALTQALSFHLNEVNARPSNTPEIYNILNQVPQNADLNDLLNARKALKSLSGEAGVKAYNAAVPQLDAEIERIAPGTVGKLQTADRNYSAALTAQEMGEPSARAQMRAATRGDLNLGEALRSNAASTLNNPQATRFMRSEDVGAMRELAGMPATPGGTLSLQQRWQNFLGNTASRLGGGRGVVQTFLPGLGLGSAAGNIYGYNTPIEPAALALPIIAGRTARAMFNRSMLNQASRIGETALARAPASETLPALRPPLPGATSLQALRTLMPEGYQFYQQ